MKTLQDRIGLRGQKKILALDGGGIRGVITLQVLERIEALLRKKSNRTDLVLADYFDYISGTSTGAIIATCLAIGMSVAHIASFYEESGPAMFSRAGLLKRFWYKFTDENLSAQLQRVVG